MIKADLAQIVKYMLTIQETQLSITWFILWFLNFTVGKICFEQLEGKTYSNLMLVFTFILCVTIYIVYINCYRNRYIHYMRSKHTNIIQQPSIINLQINSDSLFLSNNNTNSGLGSHLKHISLHFEGREFKSRWIQIFFYYLKSFLIFFTKNLFDMYYLSENMS